MNKEKNLYSGIRSLAETISHIKIYNVDEVENLIRTHFDIWKSSWEDIERYNDDLIKQRTILIAEKTQIIERQQFLKNALQTIKMQMLNGKIHDRSRVEALKREIRRNSVRLVDNQNRLSTLNVLEKRMNIERCASQDRTENKNIYHILADRYGEEIAKEIQQEARRTNK